MASYKKKGKNQSNLNFILYSSPLALLLHILSGFANKNIKDCGSAFVSIKQVGYGRKRKVK